MPVFTSWNGHPYPARAEPAEGGEYGCGSHHHQTQHHSTLQHIVFGDDGKKMQKRNGKMFPLLNLFTVPLNMLMLV